MSPLSAPLEKELKQLGKMRKQSFARLVPSSLIVLGLGIPVWRRIEVGITVAFIIFSLLWLGDVFVILRATVRIKRLRHDLRTLVKNKGTTTMFGASRNHENGRPPSEVYDPILGIMGWSTEENAWEAHVDVNEGSITFRLAGDSKPAEPLLLRAREIVQSYAEFKDMVTKFLEAQSQAKENSGRASDEVRSLEIEDICLFWPNSPDRGMIYFNGVDDLRIWRCDLVDGVPRNLGFDS